MSADPTIDLLQSARSSIESMLKAEKHPATASLAYSGHIEDLQLCEAILARVINYEEKFRT